MVKFCAVFGCSNRGGRDRVSFYRFPLASRRFNVEKKSILKSRLNAWLWAINRSDLDEKKLPNARVCSKHFVSGKPSALFDDTNPDWSPSLNLGHDLCFRPSRRKHRKQILRVNPTLQETLEPVVEDSDPLFIGSAAGTSATETKDFGVSFSFETAHSTSSTVDLKDIGMAVDVPEAYAIHTEMGGTHETKHIPDDVPDSVPSNHVNIKFEPIPIGVEVDPLPVHDGTIKLEPMAEVNVKCEPFQEVFIKMEPLEDEISEELDPF